MPYPIPPLGDLNNAFLQLSGLSQQLQSAYREALKMDEGENKNNIRKILLNALTHTEEIQRNMSEIKSKLSSSF